VRVINDFIVLYCTVLLYSLLINDHLCTTTNQLVSNCSFPHASSRASNHFLSFIQINLLVIHLTIVIVTGLTSITVQFHFMLMLKTQQIFPAIGCDYLAYHLHRQLGGLLLISAFFLVLFIR